MPPIDWAFIQALTGIPEDRLIEVLRDRPIEERKRFLDRMMPDVRAELARQLSLPDARTRPQRYDHSARHAGNRLPTGDLKSFGMMRDAEMEDTDNYVPASRRHEYTPMVIYDTESSGRLLTPDGLPLQADDAEYVVIVDDTSPGGERLMVNFVESYDAFIGHADLAGGGAVKYAGMISTNENGKIVNINFSTGHYKLPDLDYTSDSILMDEELSEVEKVESLKRLSERAPKFKALLLQKFKPFMAEENEVDIEESYASRPGTPPLKLNEIK